MIQKEAEDFIVIPRKEKSMDKSLKQIKPMLCPVCGWEDDGMEVDPQDENGGPSKEFIEHKRWFEDQRKLNPKFKITSRRKMIKEE